MKINKIKKKKMSISCPMGTTTWNKSDYFDGLIIVKLLNIDYWAFHPYLKKKNKDNNSMIWYAYNRIW